MPNTPAELAASVLQRGQHHEARNTPAGVAEAIRCYQEAIGVLRALPLRDEAGQRDLAIAWMNLGNANQKIADNAGLPDAIKAFEEALALFQTLPLATEPGYRNSAGAAWMNRGLALHRLATPEAIAEAERSQRQAVAILSTLPLEENPWYRTNLAASWLNLANALLDARPTGHFAEARAAALSGLAVAEPFEKNELAAADLSLKCRRAWCDALGQLLAAPAYAASRAELATEASDAVDDALALIRHWQVQDPRLSSELAIRFYRFGAQLYRFHQPQFLSEFLLENVSTAPAPRLDEFKDIARIALSAAMTDLQPRQFLSFENPAHTRLLETWRELQAARTEIDRFVLAVPALQNPQA